MDVEWKDKTLTRKNGGAKKRSRKRREKEGEAKAKEDVNLCLFLYSGVRVCALKAAGLATCFSGTFETPPSALDPALPRTRGALRAALARAELDEGLAVPALSGSGGGREAVITMSCRDTPNSSERPPPLPKHTTYTHFGATPPSTPQQAVRWGRVREERLDGIFVGDARRRLARLRTGRPSSTRGKCTRRRSRAITFWQLAEPIARRMSLHTLKKHRERIFHHTPAQPPPSLCARQSGRSCPSARSGCAGSTCAAPTARPGR